MNLESVRARTEQRALAEQAALASSISAASRLIALAVFLPIVTTLYLLGFPGWGGALLPMTLALVFFGTVFIFRARPWAATLGPYLFLLDVGFVFVVLLRVMDSRPVPTAVAAFSVGLLSLVLVTTGTAMRPKALAVVTLGAVVAQLLLMRKAQVPLDTRFLSTAALVTVGLIQAGLIERLRRMVRGMANSEVAWRLEHEQVAALSQARATIEQLLAEQRAQNAQLLSLQADKEALVSLLVHDLRSPLGSLRANLDWARDELGAERDRELKDALRDASDEAVRLNKMITDLLDLSRLESGSFPLARETQPCQPMLEQLALQLGAQARARLVKLEVVVSHDAHLDADHALLRRALENLVSNALRYSPPSGRVLVEARREGPHFSFAVRNEGPLIPPAVRASLFEKYVQGGTHEENRRAGFGLGLYFCKLCVDAHGGTLGLEDAPPWGASFVLRVPGVVDATAAA